jgi:hypothetical protein
MQAPMDVTTTTTSSSTTCTAVGHGTGFILGLTIETSPSRWAGTMLLLLFRGTSATGTGTVVRDHWKRNLLTYYTGRIEGTIQCTRSVVSVVDE